MFYRKRYLYFIYRPLKQDEVAAQIGFYQMRYPQALEAKLFSQKHEKH